MKNIFTLLLSILAFTVSADSLKPFTSDGCSLFPNGSLEDRNKCLPCCIEHDLAYWQGGTEEQRKEADNKLKHCVAAAGEKQISEIMHFGVTIGGDAIYPTRYRWGYGWPYERGYGALSKEEQTQVKNRLIELKALIDQTIETL